MRLKIFLIQLLFLKLIYARKHHLVIKDDVRRYITLTTFGFYNGGLLNVRLSDFLVNPKDQNKTFGLSLDKTLTGPMNPYLDSHQDRCILEEQVLNQQSGPIALFVMDMKKKEVTVSCSADWHTHIYNTEPVKYSYGSHRYMQRKKRESSPDEIKNSISSNNNIICSQVSIQLNSTVKGGNTYYSFNFYMSIESKKEEGRYNLFFHNCPSYNLEDQFLLNFSLDIEEHNLGNFLSAEEMPLPALYFMMSILFWLSGIFWVYILKKSKHPVFKIHYLMAVLVFLKSLSLLFHAINYHFIEIKGEHVEAWAILYYITHLLKGAVLFITIVLIGTGWTFIKHILADRDKKLFMIVIPLQVLANVAEIIIEESEEGDIEHKTWRDIFILVDLLCCGAILFPVVWSIRHLQEASATDGKAATNLRKLKLFRQFYLMIVCYIYFTRVIVYLLKITVPFQYGWLDEMFREMATYVFFVITGYKFRPTSTHPYFQVDSDDECEENEVLTESGLTEGLTKVTNRSIQSSTIVVSNEEERENLLSKRESSHEYD